MLRYKDSEGAVFVGLTPVQVVRAMRRLAWRSRSKRDYMKGVARRLAVLGTKKIDSDTCKAFLDSLVRTGWLTTY